jgi:hypothetical protein
MFMVSIEIYVREAMLLSLLFNYSWNARLGNKAGNLQVGENVTFSQLLSDSSLLLSGDNPCILSHVSIWQFSTGVFFYHSSGYSEKFSYDAESFPFKFIPAYPMRCMAKFENTNFAVFIPYFIPEHLNKPVSESMAGFTVLTYSKDAKKSPNTHAVLRPELILHVKKIIMC